MRSWTNREKNVSGWLTTGPQSFAKNISKTKPSRVAFRILIARLADIVAEMVRTVGMLAKSGPSKHDQGVCSHLLLFKERRSIIRLARERVRLTLGALNQLLAGWRSYKIWTLRARRAVYTNLILAKTTASITLLSQEVTKAPTTMNQSWRTWT